jgi:hypothetical protein
MPPVQFNEYVRTSDNEPFRFIGYGQLLKDGEDSSTDVCIMCPSISGYATSAAKHKKGPYHTLYYIVSLEDFDQFFADAAAPHGELTPEAKARQEAERNNNGD